MKHDSNRQSEFLARNPPELHALGCFVHGALAALHALGAAYNCRRRNWWDVAAHIAAALYDARSVHHHYRTEQILRRRLTTGGRNLRLDRPRTYLTSGKSIAR